MTRITGVADLCDLCVPYTTADGCTAKPSYRDKIVEQGLLKGMRDQEIKAKALAKTQVDDIKFPDLVEFIATEEESKDETINKLSPQ